MATKLNSMRMLDQRKITYTVREYPDTIHSANGVADYFNLSHDLVYKTLVVMSSQNKPLLVLVAGSRELDLKLFAKSIGEKRVQMPLHKEAERLTGLLTGGISALALQHKNFPVYLDHTALELDRILVSAGQRGVNLELAVADFIDVTKATVVTAS